jgi:drug/metabolite transporter (DMT)-like permease
VARPVRPIEERRLLGITFMLGGYLMFTVIDTCAKWLIQSGLPSNEVVFIRYAGQLVLVSAIFFPTRGKELLITRRPWLEVARGLCLMGSTLANFTALLFLPLTVTASISFTTPLILCALSIPFLGETVGWRRWLAIAVGFVGVLIIVQPGTAAFHPAVGLSLVGAFFTALYFLLTRKLAGVDAVTTQQFYAALVATICLAPLAVGGGWTWPFDAAGWLAFVLIGAAALIGHQFLTTAHRFAPASVLAPFGYFQIIFMTASSWLIFNQPPDVWIFVGAPIVIASGLYIWLRERQLSKALITDVAARD